MSWINKLGYTTREDCCDPLHLWVIMTIAIPYTWVEPIEEFIAWKSAYEISSLLENDDDAPYKSESFAILNYCMDN